MDYPTVQDYISWYGKFSKEELQDRLNYVESAIKKCRCASCEAVRFIANKWHLKKQ